MNMESVVMQINIDDIIPNRFQPRLSFDEQGITELADSIKEHGIIQPLTLRRLGNKYEIIAGERRYKASVKAGLQTVPAIISNIDDNNSAEIALVENVQRRDLSAIEEARSYKNLLDKGYLTQEQLAKKMGLSQSSIANKLRLLNLDDTVQKSLMENKISERHARTLLKISDKTKQVAWLNRIINERITVKQLEDELRKELDNTEELIPLSNNIPSIEDIKNNAKDLKDNKEKRSIESMMLPEDIMTEFSGALPTDVPIQKPVVEDTNLNQQIKPQTNDNKFFNFTEDEKANMNTGIDIAPVEPTFTFAPKANEHETLDFSVTEPIEKTIENPISNPIENNQTNKDPKKEITDLLDELKSRGVNLFYNEYDLIDQTQISILIDK